MHRRHAIHISCPLALKIHNELSLTKTISISKISCSRFSCCRWDAQIKCKMHITFRGMYFVHGPHVCLFLICSHRGRLCVCVLVPVSFLLSDLVGIWFLESSFILYTWSSGKTPIHLDFSKYRNTGAISIKWGESQVYWQYPEESMFFLTFFRTSIVWDC